MADGIARQDLLDAVRAGRAERMEEELEYFRFGQKHRGIARGTVVTEKRVVWGFPKIPRIFTLAKGLPRNIGAEEVCLEEKIDGFNVRVALVNGKLYAFSRGGFVEPFSTEKARGMGLGKFFEGNPGMVLCGEMLGNTPYTEPARGFDVRFLVFDIDAGDGSYLPPAEKYRLLDRYGIESVPRLGKFRRDDIAGISKVALALDKGRKEGMVIKGADRRDAVKYVTPEADAEDIAKCAGYMFDMPAGFFTQRVLRTGVFLRDHGMDRAKHARKLGEAFLSGVESGLAQAERDGHVSAEFEILIKEPKTWDLVRKHMGREVRIEEVFRREERDGLRIRFRKIYKRTSERFRDYLHGKGIED